MKTAPKPANESERLAALRSLNLLDTEAEQAFDDLSILASDICDCPIAFISLVDEARQWFKSTVGFDMDQSDRSISFCSHTILQNDLLVIDDTLKKPDFSDNPLVVGAPNIRFYAGMPLSVNGHNIGTLCIVDVNPKRLSTAQEASIKRLARQAVLLIQAKSNIAKISALNHSLIQETDYFRSLGNSIPAAVAYWDKNLHCQFANAKYLQSIRKTSDEVIGYHYDQVISNKTAAITKPYMALALEGKSCEFELPQEFLDDDGQKRIGLCKYAPHFDQDKQVIGYFVLVTDITSTKKAEKDQKLFDRIFNQTASGIIISDHQHKILSCNQAFLDMHDYQMADMVGQTPHILSPKPEKVDLMVKHIDAHGSFEGMVWGKKKNGDLIYCSLNVDSVRNTLNEVAYHVATVIEQTESFENKSKLQIANDMLERTGKMSRIGGWEYDFNLEEILWTDQVFKLHEVESNVAPTLQEAIQFYEPEARALVEEAVKNCIDTGKAFDLEVPIITAKNNHLWVRTNGELIKKDGVGSKLAGTFQDITEAKSKEIQRIQDEIKHRDTLVREVHHRIKNNLQGVSGILSQFALDNPEHALPFNEANAQLQSVAVIYGLQGENTTARIELSKLMNAIKTNNEGIWQTNITLSVDDRWQDAFIAKSEAVPIALILNELTTNAVKHQTQKHSVAIDLSHLFARIPNQIHLKDKAIISISNVGQYAAQADNSPQSVNQSGLGLMHSLMPKSGAILKWGITGDRIEVKLSLSYPTISFE